MKIRLKPLHLFSRLPLPNSAIQPLKAALVFTAMSLLLAVFYYTRSQPQLPIFYSLPRQNQQLAMKENIFLFPVLSAAILVSHLLVLRFIRHYHQILLRLFSLMTAIIIFLLSFALGRIIFITW